MKKIDSMFPTDDSLSGHGLTLTEMYRSYKNSPHNEEATYGKYLIHRLENADKYYQASPEERLKMDGDFLTHHQQGKALQKNGHMTVNDLQNFMKNPDTPKLADQLLHHKRQLTNFIQTEHANRIVDINGEPHVRLTRGLNVDRYSRGADHALASYADIPNPSFGAHMHHQLVPLKNIWFAYDYGPKEATSEKFGNENEFLVSPHQNIYNEESNTNPTKPIAYRKFHSLKINKDIFSNYLNKLTEEEPEMAAEYLKDHPLFNENHINTIVQSDPHIAAAYLHDHPLLNANHIDTIVQNEPSTAAHYLKNHPLFNANHIDTIVQNDPHAAAVHFKKHPLLNANHIDYILQNASSLDYVIDSLYNHPSLNASHINTIAQNNPVLATHYLHNHPLLNTNHIDTIVEKNPKVAGQYLHNHPLLNADHIQTIAQESPRTAGMFLNNHPLLNADHIQTIIKRDPTTAVQDFYHHHDLFNQNDIDTIVQHQPSLAANYLKNHPLLNASHIDTIVQKAPAMAVHLYDHPLLNERHINTIAEKAPEAIKHFKDHPIYQAKYGNKVQKSLQKSTKISKQLSNKVRQLLNSKAVLNKTRGTLKFPKILPKDTRPEENVKQIPKNEPEHEMYGGLYTVKPAEQQFMESALTGVPQNYRYKAAQEVRDAMQSGLRGAYTPQTKRAFAFEPDFAFKGHEAIHAMVDKAATHFGVDQKQVYEHLNSLIHPEDKAMLAHTLKANGYPAHTHHSEMVPWIHTILHYKPAREHFFESLKFYKNNVDETKQRQAVQRLGRTWNAIVKMGKELDKLP